MEPVQYPVKTREFHNHHFDSSMWNGFTFRDNDIIISTYAKSGTTWLQQIVSQLIFNGAEDLDVADMSPWLDLRVPAKEIKLAALEQQTHRRFIKTHLPVDALVFSPKAKYIYIGRDGRDVAWSLYNHHLNANDFLYETLNITPGLVGPPLEKPVGDVVAYYKTWLARDGYPFWPFWENIKTWWAVRHLPNVHFIHFAKLKEDMLGEMEKLAAFLSIDIDADKWDAMVEHCSFNYMKNNAAKSVPLGGAFWEGGAGTFINRGTNGRWKDLLSKEDCDHYEQMCIEHLGEDCTRWLNTGEMG